MSHLCSPCDEILNSYLIALNQFNIVNLVNFGLGYQFGWPFGLGSSHKVPTPGMFWCLPLDQSRICWWWDCTIGLSIKRCHCCRACHCNWRWLNFCCMQPFSSNRDSSWRHAVTMSDVCYFCLVGVSTHDMWVHLVLWGQMTGRSLLVHKTLLTWAFLLGITASCFLPLPFWSPLRFYIHLIRSI